MARQQKHQPLSSSSGRPIPWSKEKLREFWKDRRHPENPLMTMQRRRLRPFQGWLTQRVGGEQALDILAKALAVPSRDAAPPRRQPDVRPVTRLVGLRVSWRDAVLDQIVIILAKNSDTADRSRRLKRYLELARELEEDAALALTPETVNRLEEWTTERLPELERGRTDSSYRSLRITYEYLAGLFDDARAELAQRGVKVRPADWRPIVRDAWMTEWMARHWREKPRLPGQQQLTDAQADDIAATTAGRIRAPKAMALEMVAGLTNRDAGDLKKELSRVCLGPPAL